jgi:cell division protein FtsW (lipid II flippase)/cell division protein FtsI/penicillin-binding protein 2
MELSWLWLFVGFVLPVVAILILPFLIKVQPIRLALMTLGAALIPALILWIVIFYSPYWRQKTQIAWTGVKASSVPLSIGGRVEESIIGWPANAEEPQLVFHPPDNATGQTSLDINGGGAFVFDEARKQLVNGEPIAVGESRKFGDYHIRINKLGFSFAILTPEVEVLDNQGRSLAGFSLRAERTRSLRTLVAGAAMEDLDKLKDEKAREDAVAAREKLEEWAADIWLYRGDNNVQVLSRNSSATYKFTGPAVFSLKWPTMSLTFDVSSRRLSDNVVQQQLTFRAPWRLASPLPPAELAGCEKATKPKEGQLGLVLESVVRPCDVAFAMPLGGEVGDFREEVTLAADSGKFSSPDAIDNERPAETPPGVINDRKSIGTSQLSRVRGPYAFDFATVRNSPSRTSTSLLIVLALCVFVLGVALTYPRIVDTNLRVVYGISLLLWNLLCIRLLLSFRYALDPAALDGHAIKGVALAFVGLNVTPGVVLLMARLRADRFDLARTGTEKKRAMRFALGYLLLLITSALLTWHTAPRLWTGLPDNYYVGISDFFTSRSGFTFLLITSGIVALIALHARFLYFPDGPNSGSKGYLTKIFVSSWYRIEDHFNERKDFWEDRLTGTFKGQLPYFGGGIILLFLFTGFFLLVRLVLPGDKTAQEMSVPLLFLWLALLWLALRLFFKARKGKPLGWRGYLMLTFTALAMITVPSILIPVAIGDFGSVVPVLAIVLPLTFLLLVVLPMKARAGVVLAVVLIFLGGLLLYQNIEGLIPFHKQIVSALPRPLAQRQVISGSPGRLFARLLNYKRGTAAQAFAVTANGIAGGEGLGYQELLNGNQHTWENRAIAHRGGWLGLGFGKAPNRMSNIRQDTLQYDSVFSFFIVSEYGMIAGVFMMMLYGVPLVLIFIGGRQRFDGGYAIAYLITSMFFLEAVYHMGMNIGAFPMTGRNLPLLSVNSPTDLIRWTILCSIAVTVIFWRYKGGGVLSDNAQALIEEPGPSSSGGGTAPTPLDLVKPHVKYVLVFFLVPFFFVTAVLYSGWGVIADAENQLKTYNYKEMMDVVSWYLQNGVITYANGRLKSDPEKLEDPDAKSFFEREIIRFNLEDSIEKEERFRKDYINALNDNLRNVRTLEQYNNALREFANKKPPQQHRNIFHLKVKTDEEGNVVDTTVEANKDFNINFSFQDDTLGGDVVKVVYGQQPIIGPAWIRGRVRAVVSPESKLPWITQLRSAVLSREAHKLWTAEKRELTLTLDPALHQAALDFVAARGLQLHESSLSLQRPSDPAKPLAYLNNLPQRVALSVIDLTNGSTLALGGWPRMTSSRQWVFSSVPVGGATKSFWLPTSEWLEREAPRAFVARYGGERNFERALVMGSSTKPIWAAAVLKMYPNLADGLRVRGAGGDENSAFGVTVPGKGWHLNSRTSDWVNLTDYLKTSDNRYHVRLGLLGLSSGANGTVMPGGPSSSGDESLAGGTAPWRQYPAFITPIQVTKHSDHLEMGNLGEVPNNALANSELANNLRGMFSIGINRVQRQTKQVGEFGPRRSYWTGNEADDVMGTAVIESSVFDAISPQAPDFAFDNLTRPREYISMLFGGGNNLWSNVDLAAAFGSCLLGRPVIAHIVDTPVKPLKERERLDPAIARKLRPGLNAVGDSQGGTAYNALHSGNALWAIRNAGIRIYAKTGTLKAGEDEIATSRIVLALVKWKNESSGEIEAGLVFSLVAEEARTGTAAYWINDFITQHQSEILRLLHVGTQRGTAVSQTVSQKQNR